MVRDMMLEAVESRFAAIQAPHALEWLTDNGSVYTAHETRPSQSPESNGISESFVKTFKRDYVRVKPLPDAITALRQIADGSWTTTKTIPILGSKCAPQGSSCELNHNSPVSG